MLLPRRPEIRRIDSDEKRYRTDARNGRPSRLLAFRLLVSAASALALLVTRIGANHPYDASAAHDFAVLTHTFHAGPDFHNLAVQPRKKGQSA